MPLMGQYCLEGDTNCILMSITWLIAALESLFLLSRIISSRPNTSRQSLQMKKQLEQQHQQFQNSQHDAIDDIESKQQQQGSSLSPSLLPSSLIIQTSNCTPLGPPLLSQSSIDGLSCTSSVPHSVLNTLGIFTSAGLIYAWLTCSDDSEAHSPMLLQAFILNITSSLLWLLTMIRFKTPPLSFYHSCQTSMTVNLLMNALFAIVTAGSKTALHFYLYIGYITLQCMHIAYLQYILRRAAKEYLTFADENIQCYNHSSTMNSTSLPPTRLESKSTNHTLHPSPKSKADFDHNIDEDEDTTLMLTAPLVTVDKIYQQQQQQQYQQQSQQSQQQQKQLQKSQLSSNSSIVSQSLPDDISTCFSSTIQRITNLRIERFLETIKYAKKTIVYEVKYNFDSHPCVIRRSFREFSALNNMIKQKYSSKQVGFPQKKHQNSILSSSDLDQRRQHLQTFLENVVSFVAVEDLRGFFGDRCDSQQEKIQSTITAQTIVMTNTQFKARSQSNNYTTSCSKLVPETIWEDEAEHLALSATN